ncbi:MAG TPA: VWA domain-containing protein [Pyrinomonadaceae bacterium]
MLSPASRLAVSILLVVAVALNAAFAQTRPASQKQNPPKPAPTQPETPPEEPQDIETLKTDTDLVTVPLIASDKQGTYITDLRQEEFAIFEDGVQQQIAFFGKVAAPFHVVLMLDTSSSTRDKIRQIQQASTAFVEQLQPADRVKVISFDDSVRDLNEFTNNRETLRNAIYSTKSGEGTKVYDAVELALNTIRKIRGRKAIVIFTDGMDWHSDHATYEGTIRWLDEEGVTVYPIRYDTRATTEQLAHEQSGGGPQLPTISVIRQPPPSGTTAPTFPGGDQVPTRGSTQRTGPLGLPSADEILRRRREEERNRYPDRYPDPNQLPPSEERMPRLPGSEPPGGRTTTGTTSGPDDSIKGTLDLAYMTADGYLKALADKSGGRLLRADTLNSLPDAFAQIAAELRTQYMLGYYPLNKERDERYRNIKVTTTRKQVVIRARPGYLATAAK